MELGISFACGLLTAASFGTADFLAKLTTTRIGFLRTALFMQIIGSVLLIPLALPDFPLLFVQPWATLGGILLGIINALATIVLYKGFEVGRLSVVSPIASCAPLVAVLLAISFLGETLTAELAIGIAFVIVGIVLVCIQREEGDVSKQLRRGVVYALLFMVLGGSLMMGLKPVSHVLGVYVPVLLMRWMGIPTVAFAFLAWKPKGEIKLNAFYFIFPTAVLDTFGNVAYVVGVNVGTVSIVSTLAGLFSAVTVLLACAILKEKLTIHQMIGFTSIVAGITILGIFG
jgi:uncharacterized membrane protein